MKYVCKWGGGAQPQVRYNLFVYKGEKRCRKQVLVLNKQVYWRDAFSIHFWYLIWEEGTFVDESQSGSTDSFSSAIQIDCLIDWTFNLRVDSVEALSGQRHHIKLNGAHTGTVSCARNTYVVLKLYIIILAVADTRVGGSLPPPGWSQGPQPFEHVSCTFSRLFSYLLVPHPWPKSCVPLDINWAVYMDRAFLSLYIYKRLHRSTAHFH